MLPHSTNGFVEQKFCDYLQIAKIGHIHCSHQTHDHPSQLQLHWNRDETSHNLLEKPQLYTNCMLTLV